MSKVMVVYGTKSGCTRGVAERIAERLADKGVSVALAQAGQAGSPSGCDAVIVGSGVRMSQWHEPVRTWVTSNAESLKLVPTAFFSVNLTMAREPERADEVRGWTDALVEATGVSPVDVGLFAGWYEPSEFPFLERTILKAMKAPQGDFRDWAAIDAWTDAVSAQLGV